jgi:hypothetical protein
MRFGLCACLTCAISSKPGLMHDSFKEESEKLQLSPGFKSLFDPFIPKKTDKAAAELVPA